MELFSEKLNYESNTEETLTNAWQYEWSHLEDPEMDHEHMMDLNQKWRLGLDNLWFLWSRGKALTYLSKNESYSLMEYSKQGKSHHVSGIITRTFKDIFPSQRTLMGTFWL